MEAKASSLSEKHPFVKKHIPMQIDEHQFNVYIETDTTSLIGMVEPLILAQDLMKLVGVAKPLDHPYFKANYQNACIFSRFNEQQLPDDLVPLLNGKEHLYFFKEYGYTLFLLSTTSGRFKGQAKKLYDLLYEFIQDVRLREAVAAEKCITQLIMDDN